MPQLRSFSSFASTPGIGSAIVGAAGVAQRAQEAAMQAANERARIANQMAIAEMETQARHAALQQQAFKDAQELEVQKQFQQAKLGLEEMQLGQREQQFAQELAVSQQRADTDESRIAAAVEESKYKLEQQRELAKVVNEEGNTGEVSYEDSFRRNVPRFPGAEVPASVMRGAGANALGTPEFQQIQGAPEGLGVVRTGPQTYTKIDTRDTAAPKLEGVPGAPNLVKWGKTVRNAPEVEDKRVAQKKVETIEADLSGKEFALHRAAVTKSLDPKKKLTEGDKRLIQEYRAKEKAAADARAEVQRIQSIMDARASSAVPANSPATLPAGVGGGSTNQPKRLRWNPRTNRLE